MVNILTRPPVVAGMFYERDLNKLRLQIENCFKSKLGPGKLPSEKKEGKIIGAISPHAGYAYSGACAAHVFKKMAESEKPDTIIILGPTHTGLGSRASVWLGSDWETPLGTVKIDKELGKSIAESSETFDRELMPHMQEHCIEVQLPFLQYIWGDSISIIPVLIAPAPSIEFCESVGKSIAEAIKVSNKKVVILASSDFTHYGVSYGYIPFYGDNLKEMLERLDKGAIDKIKTLDLEKYIEYLNETKITICGQSAIGVLIAALKELGAEKGKLLKYYTSGDVTGSYSNSVSYAAISF